MFRAHNPRWSFAPLSGEGAARHGGRFNTVGMAALYTSATPEIAWREAQQAFPFKPQPLTICAYDVDCEAVEDFTDHATLAATNAGSQTLACDWEDVASRGQVPPSWALALRLHAAGVAAVIVPGFAPGAGPADRNVVFWRWSDAPPHQVRLIDDERRLQRDRRP